MWLLCVAIKAGRYDGNVYERRLIINIIVESASAQTVRTEVVASEDRYHHSYGLCIGDHRGQFIVYTAQDMSAECYIIATVFTCLMIENKKYDK